MAIQKIFKKPLYINLLSLSIIIIMLFISLANQRVQNDVITLSDNIEILLIPGYKMTVGNINNNDIVAKVRATDEIRQANKSISVKVDVIDVLQGSMKSESIYIYSKQNYTKLSDGNEFITLYSNNILIPGNVYYVVLNELIEKFYYMNENSYKLKDDMSVIVNDLELNFLLTEDRKYKLSEIHDVLYFFDDHEMVDRYSAREEKLNSLENR